MKPFNNLRKVKNIELWIYLFLVLMLYVPVSISSVMSGKVTVFLGLTSTKQQTYRLAQ